MYKARKVKIVHPPGKNKVYLNVLKIYLNTSMYMLHYKYAN